MIHHYDSVYRDNLDKFHHDLAENLHILPTLEESVSSNALRFLLEWACQSQNSRNIQLGRDGLKSIPRDWLLSNIEKETKACLNLEDEWEFRRLTEIYFDLDIGLAKKLAQVGLQSENEEVVEAAKDLLDWIVDAGE